MNFRNGDVVTVEGVVSGFTPGVGFDDEVRVAVGGEAVYVKRHQATLATPVIQEGDTLRRKVDSHEPAIEGVVLAVNNDHAWVGFGAGEFATWWLPDVVRVRLAGEKSKGGDV